MQPPTRSITGATLALVLSLGASACLDQEKTAPIVAPEFARAQSNQGMPRDLEVYTQNLYLGGDTGPLFSLNLTDPSSFPAIQAATSTFWASVQASDIPSRAAEVVDEIEGRMPHVVALQEAVGYVLGHLVPTATGLSYTPAAPGPDLFGSVMAEIAVRGLPYTVAVMQPTTAIALPLDEPPTASGLPALAVQDRVVMLVRNDIDDYQAYMGLYEDRLDLGVTEFVRGWGRVSFEFDGVQHHVIGTHLETQGSGNPAAPPIAQALRQIHNGQADDLIDLALGLDGKVIVVGDLNSNAEGDASDPSWTETYGKFMDAGFTDSWNVAARSQNDVGFTCCTAKDLMGPTEFDERIDFVLFRSPFDDDQNGQRRGWVHVDIVGTGPFDMTDDSGLWPSDHAGLAAVLRSGGPVN
jgi:hypothetical protein